MFEKNLKKKWNNSNSAKSTTHKLQFMSCSSVIYTHHIPGFWTHFRFIGFKIKLSLLFGSTLKSSSVLEGWKLFSLTRASTRDGNETAKEK